MSAATDRNKVQMPKANSQSTAKANGMKTAEPERQRKAISSAMGKRHRVG